MASDHTLAVKKILLADDEFRLIRLVRATLGDEFEVVEARSGPEAIEVAKTEMPDLIFLDIQMPGMDGFSACLALKAEPSLQHIPVVMLTGLTEPEDRRKGRDVGADDYFVKPFSPRQLLEKVYDVLGEPE